MEMSDEDLIQWSSTELEEYEDDKDANTLKLNGGMSNQYLTVEVGHPESVVARKKNGMECEYMKITLPNSQDSSVAQIDLEHPSLPAGVRKVLGHYKDSILDDKLSADNFLEMMTKGKKLKHMVNTFSDNVQKTMKLMQVQAQQSPNGESNETQDNHRDSNEEQQNGVMEEVPKNRRKLSRNTKGRSDPMSIDDDVIARHRMKQTVETFKLAGLLNVQQCVVADCKKKATLVCSTCKEKLYCNTTHRRMHSQEHNATCNKYKFTSKDGEKHATTVRDFEKGEIILIDKPVAVFPHNRNSSRDHEFPVNYCTKCCTNQNFTTDMCSGHCRLRACRNQETCVPPKFGATSHSEAECKALSKYYERNKLAQLRANESVIALIRTVLHKPDSKSDLRGLMLGMSSLMKIDQNNLQFKAKLELFRKYLDISEGVVADIELAQIDIAFTKLGRNTGLDILIPGKYNFNANKRDVRAIYKDASLVAHNCFPNSAAIYDNNSLLYVHAINGIKKGEQITMCLDNRCLFWPIWRRRNYLKSDYGFTCKCKRCTTATDLNTYFSAFPCSSPDCKNEKYIIPEDPTVSSSNWICTGCEAKPIHFRRVEHLIMSLENELEEVGCNAIALWEKIQELVQLKYLHWNHFIVFESSIKLFNVFWKQFLARDPNIIDWFEKDHLRLLPAANTVLHLTYTFMPYGYQAHHCLATRLAGIVKMRELAERLGNEEIENSVVEEFIHRTYFRSEYVGKTPLFELLPLNMTEEVIGNLTVLETTELSNVCDNLIPNSEVYEAWFTECPYLFKFFTFMTNKHPTLRARIKYLEKIRKMTNQ